MITTEESRYGVNDFSITVATVNGSGSQTSNLTILRALFKMGIPVSGKNLFPSNIQGLPTWYTIRVNKDGFLARREEHEIVVAMNAATFAEDLASVNPGGAFFYADDIKQAHQPPGYRCIPDAGETDCPRLRSTLQPARLRLQHGLRRRAGADAGYRPGQDLPGAQLSLQGQDQADRSELRGRASSGAVGGGQPGESKTPSTSSRWMPRRG